MKAEYPAGERCPLEIGTALKHIEHLAQAIGPRASTTAAERAGHDYVRQQLEQIGCSTRVENFASPKSAYRPYVIALGLLLAAEAGFWIVSGTIGVTVVALIAVVAVVSLLLEMMGRANPLRWFVPLGAGQNVIGTTRAAGEVRRRVAILAHVDTHRTPWIWHSRRTFRVYLGLSTIGVAGALALVGIFLVAVFGSNSSLRLASLAPACLVSLVFLMVAEAETTPITSGANDNASGVGAMLALAAKAQREPCPHTELWANVDPAALARSQQLAWELLQTFANAEPPTQEKMKQKRAGHSRRRLNITGAINRWACSGKSYRGMCPAPARDVRKTEPHVVGV
jgi:hypothetical protein